MEIDQTPQGTVQEPVTPQPNPEPAQPAPAPAAPAAQPAPQIDYKEKFSQSSREAQLLAGQKKALEERLNKLTSQDAPTDAEIREAYPLWDSMNQVEQDVYRQLLTERKARQKLESSIYEMTAEQKWRAELGELLKNPAYSHLTGDSEFEDFVFRPKNKGIDIETLANAYLFSKGKTQAAPEPQQPQDGLERGSGGPRTTEPVGLSLEEAEALRKSDPKKYRDMLIRGEITF